MTPAVFWKMAEMTDPDPDTSPNAGKRGYGVDRRHSHQYLGRFRSREPLSFMVAAS